MSSLIIVYITNPSESQARQVAQHLLNKKLIACANVLPVTSLYWWHGVIAEDTESVIIAKTGLHLWDEIQQEIIVVHPYVTPCIVSIPIIANNAYKDFVLNEVK